MSNKETFKEDKVSHFEEDKVSRGAKRIKIARVSRSDARSKLYSILCEAKRAAAAARAEPLNTIPEIIAGARSPHDVFKIMDKVAGLILGLEEDYDDGFGMPGIAYGRLGKILSAVKAYFTGYAAERKIDGDKFKPLWESGDDRDFPFVTTKEDYRSIDPSQRYPWSRIFHEIFEVEKIA